MSQKHYKQITKQFWYEIPSLPKSESHSNGTGKLVESKFTFKEFNFKEQSKAFIQTCSESTYFLKYRARIPSQPLQQGNIPDLTAAVIGNHITPEES